MKKPEEHIAHSLRLFRNQKRFRDKLLVVEVKDNLKELFGDMISEYVSNVRVSGKTLHLYLNSSTLKHQLFHEREKLLARIHEKIGYEAFEEVRLHG